MQMILVHKELVGETQIRKRGKGSPMETALEGSLEAAGVTVMLSVNMRRTRVRTPLCSDSLFTLIFRI